MIHRVLVLHGHAPQESLAPLVEALSSRCDVVAENRPGYGGVSVVGDVSPSATVAQIERAHRTEGPWIVVGHSYGAYLALLLAIRGILPLGRVVALSPTVHIAPEELDMMRSTADSLEAGARLASMLVPLWFSEAYRASEPGLVKRVESWLVHSREGLVADLRATAQWDDLRPHLGSIETEVLVRVGDADAPTPPSRAQEVASRIERARVQVVPGRGHMLGMEDARATAQSILDWAGLDSAAERRRGSVTTTG